MYVSILGGISMFCPKCGAQNEDGAARCASCLEPLPAQTTQTPDGPAAQSQGEYTSYSQPPAYTPPYRQAQPTLPPRPSTFLAGNIIVAVLSLCGCCTGAMGGVFGIVASIAALVTGIIGIVFSSMVTSRYKEGNYEGAKGASTVAKAMFFVTLGLIVVVAIIAIATIAYAITMGGDYYGDFFDLFEEYLNDSGFYYY